MYCIEVPVSHQGRSVVSGNRPLLAEVHESRPQLSGEPGNRPPSSVVPGYHPPTPAEILPLPEHPQLEHLHPDKIITQHAITPL